MFEHFVIDRISSDIGGSLDICSATMVLIFSNLFGTKCTDTPLTTHSSSHDLGFLKCISKLTVRNNSSKEREQLY